MTEGGIHKRRIAAVREAHARYHKILSSDAIDASVALVCCRRYIGPLKMVWPVLARMYPGLEFSARSYLYMVESLASVHERKTLARICSNVEMWHCEMERMEREN